MDNDWHKIALTTVLYLIGAACAVGLISLMLYIPDYFK